MKLFADTPPEDTLATPPIIRVCAPLACCDAQWEAAYLRFESAQEETRKFVGRLRRLGAADWSRESRIVELCCGRGNALHAWASLGFNRLEGIDLSERLLEQYRGPAQRYVCDVRELPFASAARDIAAVQGGLHHLETLPDDLSRTLAECHRVLRADGLLVVIEPARTPFLRLVHAFSASAILRRCWGKMDAFAVMYERERRGYDQWLDQIDTTRQLLRSRFHPLIDRLRFGKLEFVGRRRAAPA